MRSVVTRFLPRLLALLTVSVPLMAADCYFDFLHGNHQCTQWEQAPGHGLTLSHNQPRYCPVDVEYHGTSASGGGNIRYSVSQYDYVYGTLQILANQMRPVKTQTDYFRTDYSDPSSAVASVYANYCAATDRSQTPRSLDMFKYTAWREASGTVNVGWVNVDYLVAMSNATGECVPGL